MFFEDEKENLENSDSLDDLELDLDGEIDDESISWDELLKDDSTTQELVSISSDIAAESEKKTVSIKTETTDIPLEIETDEIIAADDELDLDIQLSELAGEDADEENLINKESKKDAFEVFGGETDDEADIASVDNIMDDDSQSILNELDNMEVSDELSDIESQSEEESYSPTMIQAENTTNNIPVIAGIVFAVVLVLVSLISIFTGSKNLPDTTKNPPVVQNEPIETPNRPNVSVPSEDAVQIPVVNDENAKKLKPEKKVVLSVESAGRTNPFMPTFEEFSGNLYSGIPAQVLLPPDTYGDEPDAQELMKVSVSGILFDNVKPSAIITINDVDYFVQKGDLVDDYVVLDINRQSVVIKKGTNIYKAGVGERFNQSVQIDGRAVYQSNGARQYRSTTDDHTSASDVEVRSRSGNSLRAAGRSNDRERR